MAWGKWIGARPVRGKGMAIAGLAVALMLSACASGPTTLAALADDPDANRIRVSRLDDGLLSLPVDIGTDSPVPFVIDTGATKSVLFENALERVQAHPEAEVRVHGMFGVRVTPTVTLPEVGLGSDTLEALNVAVLPAREDSDLDAGAPWGIIGMDVLERYRLFGTGKEGELILLRADGEAPDVPAQWSRIALRQSPFGQDAKSLRFLDVRVNGKVAPALLDTGSSIHVMSFEFADFPTVRDAKSKLRERYEIAGALEHYVPKVIVEGVDFRAGSRVWYDKTFIVKDVHALEALGVAGRPFMIAGVDLLADETFFLDLATNELRMPKVPSPYGVIVNTPAGGAIHIGSATRNRSSSPP